MIFSLYAFSKLQKEQKENEKKFKDLVYFMNIVRETEVSVTCLTILSFELLNQHNILGNSQPDTQVPHFLEDFISVLIIRVKITFLVPRLLKCLKVSFLILT